MNAYRQPLFALSLLFCGCQSADTRLLLAENTLTAAQNGWTDLLSRGVVKDRASVTVGTATLNHANAVVARAYTARRQPTTMGADGKPIDILPFWIEEVERAVRDAVATYEQIRKEKAR